jgi:hypothetical protein
MNKSVRERIYERLVTDLATGCLIWPGSGQTSGYGQIYANGTMRLVHRLTWELEHGPIPAGLEIDHLCRVRRCANPAHLELVTHRENIRRSASPLAVNAAKTRCDTGHEFNAANTGFTRLGRYCIPCRRAGDNRRYAARKEASYG